MPCRIHRPGDTQNMAPRRESLKSGGYGGLGSVKERATGEWGLGHHGGQ